MVAGSADPPNPIRIDLKSVQSLLVSPLKGGRMLATATGFVAVASGKHFLVTNYHVASGREPASDRPLFPNNSLPDTLQVLHNATTLGSWVAKNESLFKPNGSPRWVEHPVHGHRFDVVALPLSDTTGCQLYPYDLSNLGPPVLLQPSSEVSIVGFPFGLTAGAAFAIWKTGHVAGEVSLDYGDLPCFLVDATTRGGMSGSPAIARRFGTVPMENGDTAMFSGGPVDRVLGVYSGRIHDQSEIGIVWKAMAVQQLLLHAESLSL